MLQAQDEIQNQMDSGNKPEAVLGEVNKLARDILCESRASLMTSVRFMDVALWNMPFVNTALSTPVATDGYSFYFNSLRVAMQYQNDPNETLRDYLHAILHCVFRHPFDGKHSVLDLWDLACDIAVEAACIELCGLRFPSMHDEKRNKALNKIQNACSKITAQKVYRLLLLQETRPDEANELGITTSFIEDLYPLFKRDDHSVWTRTEERPQDHMRVGKERELLEDDGTMKVKGDKNVVQTDDEEDDSPAQNTPGAPSESKGGQAAEGIVENADRFTMMRNGQEYEYMEDSLDDVVLMGYDNVMWTDISKQLEIEIEEYTGKAGMTAGTFMVNLTVTNRKTYDYRDFLKRFSMLSEEMKVSTEEFDYVYYTYGLNLYKNMPLVEPLEYQESDRVREFVIAVDTSASCAGELVKKFVQKTYDVLKSSAGFGRKINVHVIQCDCEIRKDTKITSINDMDEGFSDIQVRGFGGTDFRPVFKYVNEMIAAREFTNLKGLIYLTDGMGKYPEAPPDYETVFVFVNDTDKYRRVPPWAMKVIMDEDDIIEL